jgi:hypothetical protein
MPKELKRGTLLYIWYNDLMHSCLVNILQWVFEWVCRHLEQLAMDKLVERACKKLLVL